MSDTLILIKEDHHVNMMGICPLCKYEETAVNWSNQHTVANHSVKCPRCKEYLEKGKLI